jgi:hypothetical protein
MLTLIGGRWWRSGATQWHLGLGITPSRGRSGASLAKAMSSVAPGARAVLLDLMKELGRLCFKSGPRRKFSPKGLGEIRKPFSFSKFL